MRKILVLLLVFGLVLGCAGVVSAALDITVTPASPKAGESVTFAVTGAPDNVTKYEWKVDTVKQSGEQNTFSHTFPTAKSYTVEVTAYNNTTSVGTKLKSVDVSAGIVAPVLGTLTSNNSSGGPAPLTVQFNVTVTSGNPTEYEWNFGGGSNETSTTSTKTHTFEAAGTYRVSVVAVNGTVKSAPKTLSITVTASQIPVVSKLEADVSNGMAPLPVLFNATASNSPTKYIWTFGDGSTSKETTTNTVTHVFTKAGTHTVNVTAENSDGKSQPKSTTISVNANTSTYKVAIDATPVKGVAPLTVKFKLNTTIPTDQIHSEKGYEWDFGYDSDDKDDLNEYSYDRDPKDQTYSKDGTYTVKVIVKTKLGDTYDAEIKITVSDLVASFDASKTSGPAPLDVKFTDTSSGPTSWKWTIYKTSDGSRTSLKELTSRNITYTFDQEGKYEVELAAIKGSKTVTTYKEITVSTKATTAPTTQATTKATTAPTSAATTSQAVKAAALSSDDNPVPNPMDIIEEFIRLIKVMLVPENYNLAI